LSPPQPVPLPALQAPDQPGVARGARGPQPGIQIGGVLIPLHALPALVVADPFGEVVENERAKYRFAAGVETRPPEPGQTGKQRVAQALVIGLVLKQLLDGSPQLLIIH
jgi:hypothetical protein